MKSVSGALIVASALLVSVALVGCKANEQPQGDDLKTPHGMAAPHGAVAKRNLPVLVPDAVKGQWKGVRVAINDKIANRTAECDIPLETEVELPKTGLRISARNFLPQFSMGKDVITSLSNEAKNPAVQVTILEGKKELFNGWLFQMFPTVHSFQHPKYGITLLSGIPAE